MSQLNSNYFKLNHGNCFWAAVLVTTVVDLQDLPEHFEDNMKPWMDNFQQLLSADNKLLQTEVCVNSNLPWYSFLLKCTTDCIIVFSQHIFFLKCVFTAIYLIWVVIMPCFFEIPVNYFIVTWPRFLLAGVWQKWEIKFVCLFLWL